MKRSLDASAGSVATPPVAKLSYRIDEAAAATGISVSGLYEDIAAGQLTARKRGRATLILADELAAYLAAMPVLGKQ